MFQQQASNTSSLKWKRIIAISHREGLEEVKTNEKTSVLTTISDTSEQLMTIVRDLSSYLNLNSILRVRVSNDWKLLVGVTPTQEEQEIIQSEEEQRLKEQRLEEQRLEEQRKQKMSKLRWLGKRRARKVEKELANKKKEERQKARTQDDKARKQAEKYPDVVSFSWFRWQLQFWDKHPEAASSEEVARIKAKIAKDEAEAGKFVTEAQNELTAREDSLTAITSRVAEIEEQVKAKQGEIDTKQGEIDSNDEILRQKADLVVTKWEEETEKKWELAKLIEDNEEIGKKVNATRKILRTAKSSLRSKRSALTKAEQAEVSTKKWQTTKEALQEKIDKLNLLETGLKEAEAAERDAGRRVGELEEEQRNLQTSFATRKTEIESKLDMIVWEKTRANEVITEITKTQGVLEAGRSDLLTQKDDLIAQKDELNRLLTGENAEKKTAEWLVQEALRKLEAEQEKLAVSWDIEKSAKFARIAFDEKMEADRLEHKIKTLVNKEVLSLVHAQQEVNIEEITMRIRWEVMESIKNETNENEDNSKNEGNKDIVQRIDAPGTDIDGSNVATIAARGLLES